MAQRNDMKNKALILRQDISDNAMFDHKRFVTLLSLNHSKVYNYILMLVPNHNEADDIMQEASVAMYEKFGTFKEGTDFLSWAIVVAKYQVLNYLKKRKREKIIFNCELVDVLGQKAEHLVQDQEIWIDALRKCVSQLSSTDRQIIKMRFYENVGIKTMTERLGCSFQKVYRNLSRINGMLVRCVRITINGMGY